MALLDTTVLIDLARRPQSPSHQFARAEMQRLHIVGEMLFTSRINEAEFRVGPEVVEDRARELENVERVLAGISILEFNAESARRYAVIKSRMLKIGRPIGDCDFLIASVALAHGQLLVTRNPRHFLQIGGLRVQSY